MHRLTKVWRRGGDGRSGSKTINESGGQTGGEAGIRTLDTAFGPYNGLANRRLQPLGHLTVRGFPKDFAGSAWLDRSPSPYCASTGPTPPADLRRSQHY